MCVFTYNNRQAVSYVLLDTSREQLRHTKIFTVQLRKALKTSQFSHEGICVAVLAVSTVIYIWNKSDFFSALINRNQMRMSEKFSNRKKFTTILLHFRSTNYLRWPGTQQYYPDEIISFLNLATVPFTNVTYSTGSRALHKLLVNFHDLSNNVFDCVTS